MHHTSNDTSNGTSRDTSRDYPLSYSSQALFTSCNRKYQLYKLLNYQPLMDRTDTVHTAFGTAVGAGVVILLEDPENLSGAMHECFINYSGELLWEHIYSKSLLTALQSIRDFQSTAREWHEMGYRIAEIEGRPATEVSFRINVEGMGHYVGYIDAIMYNSNTDSYRIIEVKTMQGEYDSDMWKNRTQDVGYLFVGKITGNYDATTCYPTYVCKKDEKRWSTPVYHRTEQDFKDFATGLYLTFKGIELCEEVGFFPRNGNCKAYSTLCPAFADCNKEVKKVPSLYSPEKDWDIEVTINLREGVDNA